MKIKKFLIKHKRKVRTILIIVIVFILIFTILILTKKPIENYLKGLFEPIVFSDGPP